MSHRIVRKAHRDGAVLALVMIGLLVASLIGLTLIQSVLSQTRQMQTLSRQQQCFWLAEAGVQRATQAIAKSTKYEGETWTVPAEVLDTPQPGVVMIELSAAKGTPALREVRVEARLSEGPVRRIICRREFAVPVPPERPAP